MSAAIQFAPSASITPAWLWRLHSWWFAAQVGANVIAAGLFIGLVREMDWAELGLGLLLGQGFLLSVWLSLGGLPNVARFVSVFLVTLASALAVSDQAWANPSWEEWMEHASQIFIVCFFMVLLVHGLLLPLRWLLGWRLDFDAAYHRRETNRRMQVGLVHILGWTTFIAIPCGLIRLLPANEVADISITCLIISAMTLPVAAPIAMLIVSRRTWLLALVALVTFAVVWTAEVFIPNPVFEQNLLQFNIGILAAVTGNLLVLRLFGLKLFSVLELAGPSRIPVVQAPHYELAPSVPSNVAASASGS